MHLWANGPAPVEWVEYIICEKFHKLPSEVRGEAYGNLLDLLACMEAENKVKATRAKAKNRNRK